MFLWELKIISQLLNIHTRFHTSKFSHIVKNISLLMNCMTLVNKNVDIDIFKGIIVGNTIEI